MKKAEMHCHVSPISCCSRLNAVECMDKYAQCGFDIVTITNHYSRAYIETHGVSEQEWLDRYIKSYYETQKVAAERGIKTFFGAEVSLFAPYSAYMRDRFSMEYLTANYADYLLMGVTEKFLRDYPMLCDLDQKELHDVCRKNNVLLFQAHPFRTEQHHSLKDVTELDGLEINGCSAFATACEDKVLQTAKDNNLIVICGGDTHVTWHRLRSATFLPDDVTDEQKLVEYLKKVRVPKYSITLDDPYASPVPQN